ncbi:MAG: OmpH family outer membrane protein [Tannerella sp.]|jgi:outer membrane protein|nr:OmpH family outer membrane protein [Tannerella sp.]
MKEKVHYLIEAVLGIAVIVLFALFLSGNRKTSFSGTDSLDSSSIADDPLPIAYINMDSLMQNYQYSVDVLEQVTRKYESSQANLNERLRRFQTEVDDYDLKAKEGTFVSEESARSQQQRLVKKQEELQQLREQLSQEFNDEQMRLNDDLRKTIITQLKEFNRGKGYHIIYGKVNDNILFSDDMYDITSEVIEFLNKNYTPPADETVTPAATTTPEKK